MTGRPPFNVDSDWFAYVGIIALAAIAPAFLRDEAAFFSYLNNVTSPRPIFFHGGYVPLIPELAAYSVKGLPFVVQALLYRVVPLCVALLLYRELRYALEGSAPYGWLLTVGMMGIVWAYVVEIWANLTFAPWSALVVASLHVIRVTAERRRYSAAAWAGVAVSAMSLPLGILLAPIFLWALKGERDRVRTAQNAVLATLVVAWHAFVIAGSPMPGVVTLDAVEISSLFAHGLLGEHRLHNVAALGSLFALVTLSAMQLRQGSDAPAGRIVATVAGLWIGVASLGAYLVSERLAGYEGGMAAQHALPILVFALLAVANGVMRERSVRRRGLLAGVFLGCAISALSMRLYVDLRGPLEIAFMKYRFLMVAQDFRKDCRRGDGLVFEDEHTSPVVLCEPQPFAVGVHPQTAFTPAVGVASSDRPINERPYITVGKPVF